MEQHRRGEPITAGCNKCGHTLAVTVVAAVGALVVTCPQGHISFHATREKGALLGT
jgi:hypothetical protein